MTRYFLTLSYDGTDFNGWQVQENTPNTVQQVLEEKMSMLLKEKVSLTGCGRTDTGVHARHFVAHFDSANDALHTGAAQLLYKINTVLPPAVAVHGLKRVQQNAHARFDAEQRVYYYYLSRRKDPFRDRYTWHVYGDLDFDVMNLAAERLLRVRDFTSFSKHHTQTKTNLCVVRSAGWLQCGEHEYRFAISADRFLRGMVRAIVGTMVMLGRQKISLADFDGIIEAKDRARAGNNAPANALFLAGIKYPGHIYA